MALAPPSWSGGRRWLLHPWVRVHAALVEVQQRRSLLLNTLINAGGGLSSGDIQIGMVEKKGALEVEVIRARGLVGKPGSKSLPGNLSRHAVVKAGTRTRSRNPRGQCQHVNTASVPSSALSTLCEGLPSGERRLHSQKEN